MKNYVSDVQDLTQTRAKSRDNWWQKLNHNFQTAVLVGNPGTPFKQKGSMWLAMSELDPRAVAKAAVTSLNPGNKQMKAARDNPLLQFRAKGNIDSSITDALQDQNTLFSKMAAKRKVLKSIQNWIPAADVREISKVYLTALGVRRSYPASSEWARSGIYAPLSSITLILSSYHFCVRYALRQGVEPFIYASGKLELVPLAVEHGFIALSEICSVHRLILGHTEVFPAEALGNLPCREVSFLESRYRFR